MLLPKTWRRWVSARKKLWQYRLKERMASLCYCPMHLRCDMTNGLMALSAVSTGKARLQIKVSMPVVRARPPDHVTSWFLRVSLLPAWAAWTHKRPAKTLTRDWLSPLSRKTWRECNDSFHCTEIRGYKNTVLGMVLSVKPKMSVLWGLTLFIMVCILHCLLGLYDGTHLNDVKRYPSVVR